LDEDDETRAGKTQGRKNLTNIVTENHNNGVYYIGGLQAFMDDQRHALSELGVNANDIHREIWPRYLNHIIEVDLAFKAN